MEQKKKWPRVKKWSREKYDQTHQWVALNPNLAIVLLTLTFLVTLGTILGVIYLVADDPSNTFVGRLLGWFIGR